MNKRNSVVIAAILLLLIGSGSFVFANPSEEDLSGPSNNGVTDSNNSNKNQTNQNSTNNNNSNNSMKENQGITDNSSNTNNGNSVDLDISGNGTTSNSWYGSTNTYPSSSSTMGGTNSNEQTNTTPPANPDAPNIPTTPDPVIPEKPNETNPIKPEEPSKPEETNPTKPEEPSKPEETNPIKPGEPSKPEETNPIKPGEPSKPEETNPIKPEEPSKPEETDPIKPGEPSKPEETNPDAPSEEDQDKETIQKALEYLEQAKKTKKKEDIEKAYNEIQKIKNEEKKKELLEEVKSLQKLVDLIELLEQLSKALQEAKNKEDIEAIRNLIATENITSRVEEIDSTEEEKEKLQTTLNQILHVVEDIEAPVINGLPEKNITNQDVSLEITDDNDVVIFLNGVEVTREDLKEIKDENTYHILIKDSAFNETEVTFTIDKTAPVATLTYSTTTTTNEDVVVTLNSIEEINITNNDGKSEVIFTENGEFTFEFEDEAGNKATAVAKVENIDKEAPKYQTLTMINKTRINSDLDKKIIAPSEEILVSVSFLEKLNILPTITINGIEITSQLDSILSDETNYVYTVSYIISKNEFEDGYINITVKDYKDEAGNMGEVLTNDNLNSEVLYLINEPGLELIENGAFNTKNITINEPGFAYMTIYNYRTRKTVTVKEHSYSFAKAGTYLISVYNDQDELIKEATMAYDNVLPVVDGIGMNNNKEEYFMSGGIYDSLTLEISDNYAIHKIKRVYEDSRVDILEQYELTDYNTYMTDKDFTESGIYKIVVEDKAGNEIEIEFTIR